MTGDNVLFQNCYLLGMKNISSQTHKARSWYLVKILFKISEEHPYPFYMGVPPLGVFTFTGTADKHVFQCKFPVHALFSFFIEFSLS